MWFNSFRAFRTFRGLRFFIIRMRNISYVIKLIVYVDGCGQHPLFSVRATNIFLVINLEKA